MKKFIVSTNPVVIEWVKEVLPSFKDAQVMYPPTSKDLKDALVVALDPAMWIGRACHALGNIEFPKGVEYPKEIISKEALKGAIINWYEVFINSYGEKGKFPTKMYKVPEEKPILLPEGSKTEEGTVVASFPPREGFANTAFYMIELNV